MHTRFPHHKSTSVQEPKKQYQNQWDTSLFYPATVSAKSKGYAVPVETMGTEAKFYAT